MAFHPSAPAMGFISPSLTNTSDIIALGIWPIHPVQTVLLDTLFNFYVAMWSQELDEMILGGLFHLRMSCVLGRVTVCFPVQVSVGLL